MQTIRQHRTLRRWAANDPRQDAPRPNADRPVGIAIVIIMAALAALSVMDRYAPEFLDTVIVEARR